MTGVWMILRSRREVFLRAALPPSQCLTEKTADRRDQRRLTARPGPARRFARPSGGTEEFLRRQTARPGSRRAQAKGPLADLRYVFGAAGRAAPPGGIAPDHDGNRNDGTSRRRQQGTTLVTRGTTVPNRKESSREFRGARLDFSVHIWVRPGNLECPRCPHHSSSAA